VPTAARSAARCAARGQVEPVFVDKRRGPAERARATCCVPATWCVTMGAGSIRRRRARAAGALAALASRGASTVRRPEARLMAAALSRAGARFAGRLRRDEPMSRTRPGTSAARPTSFFEPRDRDDLAAFLRELPPRCRCCGSASAATCWCATAACAAR
jgi:hypothetical protein